MVNGNGMLAEPDTIWFDENKEAYLARPDFIEYQKVAGVDFRDLKSSDPYIRGKAQDTITSQSAIFNSIHSEHSGHKMPDVYYTHDPRVGKLAPDFNPELEALAFQFDMGDSLRRRLIALSFSLLPEMIERVSQRMQRPIVIYNLGSGVGLDIMNALMNVDNNLVSKVLNYDTNSDAIARGEKIRDFLVNEGKIKKDKIEFYKHTLTKPQEKYNVRADGVIGVGIICGLKDNYAQGIFDLAYANLNEGGEIIASSSNQNMLCLDPLPSFLIQHIGSSVDSFKSWGLSCREIERKRKLLENSGFNVLNIYGDSNFPGREKIEEKMLSHVDNLIAEAFGWRPNPYQFRFPSREVLEKRIDYNWLSIGLKE